MGHRIAIMSEGVLQQVGPPQDVYEKPANLFVARFIGNPPMNTVTGHGRDRRRRRQRRSRSPAATCPLPDALREGRPGTGARPRSCSGVRPEHLRLDERRACPGDGDGRRVARPRAPRASAGSRTGRWSSSARRRRDVRAGGRARGAHLATEPQHLHVFDATTERPDRPRDGDELAAPEPPHPRGRPRVPAPAARRSSSSASSSSIRSSRTSISASSSTPPFPGLPKQYVGFDQYQDVLTRSDFLDSLRITIGSRCSRCRPASRSASGWRCSPTRSCRASASTARSSRRRSRRRSRSPSVIFGTLFNPHGRAAAVDRARPDATDPRQPEAGALLGGLGHRRSGRTSGSASSSCRPACRRSPTSCYEAAAGRRRRTVVAASGGSRCPLLSPTIFFAVVVGSIFAFQTFGQIDLLTPGRSAEVDQRADVLHLQRRCASTTTTGRPRSSRSRCSPSPCPHAGPVPVPRAAGAL